MHLAFSIAVIILYGLSSHARPIEPERLFYLSNGEVLQGLVYKPEGKGPFPAVVHNQSTAKDFAKDKVAKLYSEISKFYTSNGYVLFLPGRRKWHSSESEDDTTSTNTTDGVEHDRKVVEDNLGQAEIVFAAIETLKAQSYVDARKVFVTGHGGGGTTTLLMAEKNAGIQGFVVFSPAAGIWARNGIIRTALKHAITNATAPVFLIQNEDDPSLLPSKVLGKELEQKGHPNRTKVYRSSGKDSAFFSLDGTETWGPDVLRFLKEASK